MSESAARGIAGLANFRLPTDEEQAELNRRTMRDVVRVDAKYNPQATTRDGIVTVAGAGVVTNGVALAPQPNCPGVTDGVPNNWGVIADVPKGPAGGETAQRLIERMTPSHSIEGRIAMLSLVEVDACLADLTKRPPSRETAAIGSMLETRRAQLIGSRTDKDASR